MKKPEGFEITPPPWVICEQNATLAETIRQSVTALEVGEALGLRPVHGRCPCPFHNGKDANLRLSSDGPAFYCFVCHVKGEIVKLVRQVKGCTFPEALAWLNSAFNLGLPINQPMNYEALKAAQMATERRTAEHENEKRLEALQFDAYLTLGQIVNGLERDALDYRPKHPNDAWDPRFTFALQMLPEMREAAREASAYVIKK